MTNIGSYQWFGFYFFYTIQSTPDQQSNFLMFNFIVPTVFKKVVIILSITLATRNTRLILSQEVSLTALRSVPMTEVNEKSEIPLHAPNKTKRVLPT